MTLYENFFYFKRPIKGNILKNKQPYMYQSNSKMINNLNDIEEEVVNKVNIQISHNYTKVIITDNLSKECQEFYMKNQNNEFILYNKNNQVLGEAKYWIDNNIPPSLKSKEGIVLDPDTNEELFEFIIFNTELSLLPKKIYREYTFIESHQDLQYSNEVDLGYSYF